MRGAPFVERLPGKLGVVPVLQSAGARLDLKNATWLAYQGFQACNPRVVPLGFEILSRDFGGLHCFI